MKGVISNTLELHVHPSVDRSIIARIDIPHGESKRFIELLLFVKGIYSAEAMVGIDQFRPGAVMIII